MFLAQVFWRFCLCPSDQLLALKQNDFLPDIVRPALVDTKRWHIDQNAMICQRLFSEVGTT